MATLFENALLVKNMAKMRVKVDQMLQSIVKPATIEMVAMMHVNMVL